MKKEEQIILVGDLTVELEGSLEKQSWLIDRIGELKKEKQAQIRLYIYINLYISYIYRESEKRAFASR